MQKAGKIGGIIAGLCIMFILGVWYAGKVNFLERQEETGFARQHIQKRGYSGKPQWNKEMTEDEEDFFQEHVMGAWSFSERLVTLEEGDMYTSNFSEQGVKELENIWIILHDDGTHRSGYHWDTLSEPEDIYLFAAYGGMSPVRYPVYHIDNHVDEKRIALRDIYADGGVYYVSFPEECELVHVVYDLGFDREEYPSIDTFYWADDLYVDPENTDVLYLNFCGLWKLERELDTYDSGGKSATG